MTFKLVLLPQAQADVESIIDYLHARSPSGANTWFDCWLQTCETLKNSADAYGLAPENEASEFNVQQLVFRTPHGNAYRVLFRIVEQTVHVYHVRGTGQDFVAEMIDIPAP